MEFFRTTLEKNQLFDLGYSGDMYTWSNNQVVESFTKESLDKAVANNLWKCMYNGVKVEVLSSIYAYHGHLVISFTRGFSRQYRSRRAFRFKASWIKEEECANIIKQKWHVGVLSFHHLETVQTALRNCSSALSKWSKQRSPITEKAIKDKFELIKRLQATQGLHNVELIKNLQSEVGGILE